MSLTVSWHYKVDTQSGKKKRNKKNKSTEADCERSSQSKFKATAFIAVMGWLVAEQDCKYHPSLQPYSADIWILEQSSIPVSHKILI